MLATTHAHFCNFLCMCGMPCHLKIDFLNCSYQCNIWYAGNACLILHQFLNQEGRPGACSTSLEGCPSLALLLVAAHPLMGDIPESNINVVGPAPPAVQTLLRETRLRLHGPCHRPMNLVTGWGKSMQVKTSQQTKHDCTTQLSSSPTLPKLYTRLLRDEPPSQRPNPLQRWGSTSVWVCYSRIPPSTSRPY